MHRFYVAGEIKGDSITLAEAGQLHHLKDVLRLKVGDGVIVFDDGGYEYDCVIAEMRKNRTVLAVGERRHAAAKKASLTVACAIPKKAGMDDIVDNLTQLGVDVIIPMATERVIVRLNAAKQEARRRRWREIARSAAQQSGRPGLPLVAPVTDFASVVARAGNFDLRLIPALSGERRHIREVLAGSSPASILVLIGPEGDFTPEEIALAQDAGFIPVSLGENVLRVATAAAAVASYLRLALT
jgi:16S rRNA (uracil1498-N3)-methyltransferase